jgi:(2R)-ethylmalonyl-CoA mutase
VHVVGLSILSGAHVQLAKDVQKELAERGLGNLPIVVGGIIPERDAELLKQAGIRAVYTPKHFEITRILEDLLGFVEEARP